MQMIEISKLKSHPRNKEFFDDITGDKWKDFIKSIVRRGIVEAIVAEEDPITHDLIIVSGHQRVRGCKEIGILEVPCNIVHYPEFDEKTGTPREDMILEDLISTNIMQRGIGNCNPMKMAKCIMELERIYGIKKGGDRGNQYKEAEPNNSVLTDQKQLAKQLNISTDTLQNYKKLTTLIPELQTMVENDALKATTAYKIWAKLSQEEQEKFFNDIGQEKIKQITQKQTEKIINEKKQLEKSNKALTQSFNELSQKYNKEKNNIKTVEVDNTDYSIIDKNKELQEKINNLQTKLQLMEEKADAYEQDSLDYQKMKEDITYLTKQKDDLGRQLQAITDISGLVVEINHLIKDKLAPVRYSKALLEAKDDEIVLRNLINMLETVEQWCSEMRKYIPRKENYVEVM
jgi:ParB-like chromosome segregation protein Spo0J